MNDDQYRKELKAVVRKIERKLHERKAMIKASEGCNRDNTSNSCISTTPHPTVKLYAGKGAGEADAVIQKYTEDKITECYVDFLIDAIEDVMNVRVSRSVLIRQAIKTYRKHFDDLMCEGFMSKDLQKFINSIAQERKSLYSVANRKESSRYGKVKKAH